MKKRTQIILIGIYILAFCMMCLGATFAYFTNLYTAMISHDTEVQTATMTSLIFDAGLPITLHATPENFGEHMGNLKSSTYAAAIMRKGDEAKTVTTYYNLKVVLAENNFIYTTGGMNAELLLKIYDPNGKEIKKLGELNYVTIKGVSGFDITGKAGEYVIADNYAMKTNSKEEYTHKWNVDVVFVNHDMPQNYNIGRYLRGYLTIGPVEGETDGGN